MHRLEQRRKLALGLRFADGAIPIVPVHRRPEIGQDVAEQIRPHDDVEPVGVLHEVRGEDVDVVLVDRARRDTARPSP